MIHLIQSLHLFPSNLPTNLSRGLSIKKLFFCPKTERYDDNAEEYQLLLLTDEYNIKNAHIHLFDGDIVMLPDNTLGKLNGKQGNDICFTDGLDGKTFTSRLHISKYRRVVASNSPELTPKHIISKKDILFVMEYFNERDILPTIKDTPKIYFETICCECERATSSIHCNNCHKETYVDTTFEHKTLSNKIIIKWVK